MQHSVESNAFLKESFECVFRGIPPSWTVNGKFNGGNSNVNMSPSQLNVIINRPLEIVHKTFSVIQLQK